MTPREELQALYDRIPALPCKRQCQKSCASNVIELGLMSVLEYDRLTMGGVMPHTGLVEDCVLLADGKCSLYAMRPLICRLWGVVDQPGHALPVGVRPGALDQP